MGAETGVWVSKTSLKILYKSFSEYLGTLVAVTGALATGDFVPKDPMGWPDNLSSDLRGGEESKGATGGATEGAIERRSRWGCLRLRTEVILELISSKNTFSNGLANLLGMKKSEL